MTDEEIGVVVAQACGVKCRRRNGTGQYERYGKHEWFRINMGGKMPEELRFAKCDHVTPDPSLIYERLLPDFPNNLNAIAVAIKTLNFDELMRWHVENRDIAYRERTSPELTTARQRCEAFIRVKCPSKWKD